MKKRISTILNLVIIIGTLVLVLFFTLRSDNLSNSVRSLQEMGIGWIALCLMGYLGFVACDAVALWFFLHRQGYHVNFFYIAFVSMLGQFYSYVTPGATGGQPMQVYYLHKRGVPIGLTSSALVIRLFSFQFMLSLFGTVLWIMNGDFIAAQVGGNMWFLVLGYVYNLVVISLLMLIALKRGIVGFMIQAVVKIGAKLHLVKDPQKSLDKAARSVDSFHDSLQLLLRRPLDLVIQMIIGAVQLLSLMLILWFIYLGLHQHTATFSQVLSMNVMEYLSAAYMPTPGASGAQEVTFTLYFGGQMFSEEVIPAALLLWRFFTYYLALIIGIVLLAAYGWHVGEKPRNERLEAEKMKEEMSEPRA